MDTVKYYKYFPGKKNKEEICSDIAILSQKGAYTKKIHCLVPTVKHSLLKRDINNVKIDSHAGTFLDSLKYLSCLPSFLCNTFELDVHC